MSDNRYYVNYAKAGLTGSGPIRPKYVHLMIMLLESSTAALPGFCPGW